jgi:hypothetical protein
MGTHRMRIRTRARTPPSPLNCRPSLAFDLLDVRPVPRGLSPDSGGLCANRAEPDGSHDRIVRRCRVDSASASVLLFQCSMAFSVPTPLPWPCPRCGLSCGFTEQSAATRPSTRYHCSLCNNVWSIQADAKRNPANRFVSRQTAALSGGAAASRLDDMSPSTKSGIAAMTSVATRWLIGSVRSVVARATYDAP